MTDYTTKDGTVRLVLGKTALLIAYVKDSQ